MLKRCMSESVGGGDAGVAKKCRTDDASSGSCAEEDDDETDGSWVPSSDEEDGDGGFGDGLSDGCCAMYSTRSHGEASFPVSKEDSNALMDRVDEEVDNESDLSSESDEDDEDESDEDEDSEEESDEDDEYSDDDSFVTSDDEADTQDSPASLVRCDAGIPDLKVAGNE